LKRICVENAKAIKYRTIDTAKREAKPKFAMMKPPAAGPMMLDSDGIIEDRRLIVRARAFDSLNLNCRRLKLGQKVDRLMPCASPSIIGSLT
jgi:hypothetical protein